MYNYYLTFVMLGSLTYYTPPQVIFNSLEVSDFLSSIYLLAGLKKVSTLFTEDMSGLAFPFP